MRSEDFLNSPTYFKMLSFDAKFFVSCLHSNLHHFFDFKFYEVKYIISK